MKKFLESLKKQASESQGIDRGIIFGLLVSVLVSVAAGLSLIWLNIEQTRLSYNAHNLQRKLENTLELNAKLDVEYNFLMSPQELSKKAASIGLRAALPGEIRRLAPVMPTEVPAANRANPTEE